VKKYEVMARVRPQNGNHRVHDFVPGQVVALQDKDVWVKATVSTGMMQFQIEDFRDGRKPKVGDLVCYETWRDFTASGWCVQVVR
jgi:hypothetical protein